jgi:hypothetical protein
MGKRIKRLSLGDVWRGMPEVARCTCKHYADAARACLSRCGHARVVRLLADGDESREFALAWGRADDRVMRTHMDLQDAAEHGAHAVSFLMVRELTNYQVIRQSRKGTGVDWHLGRRDRFLFQDAARLEVSGILKGSEADLAKRVQRKLEQTSQSDLTRLPAFVSVTEFGTPRTRFLKKK